MRDFPDNRHNSSSFWFNVWPANADSVLEKRVLADLDIYSFSCDEGVMMDDSHGIMYMNVPVNDLFHTDIGDVYLGNVYTVWTVVAMTIVDFSGSKRNP